MMKANLILRQSLFLLFCSLLSLPAFATTVRLQTNLGDIDILMLEQDAPKNVANFLTYVNNGDYDNSIFHRLIYGFVLQGGQYYSDGSKLLNIPANAPVVNEFKVSNTKYTVSMAKLGGQPNSATNNFFINLNNNSANLDFTNDGFTVFGKITQGQEVVDTIASLYHQCSECEPLYKYVGVKPGLDNLVYINKAYVLSDKFQINAGLSGAWFNPATNGQGVYLEVLPTSKVIVAAWFTYDLLPPEEGASAQIGAPEHRWLTLQGTYNEDTLELSNLALSEGGIFDSGEPVVHSLFGHAQIVFDSCERATLYYEIPNPALSGSIPLHRQSGDNVALCEQLEQAANHGDSP